MTRRLLVLSLIALVAVAFLAACGSDDDTNDSNGSSFEGRDSSVVFSEVCTKSDEKQFSAPEVVIDTSMAYKATISTAKGDIVVDLFSDTPVTTNNFVFLACRGFYDGLTFHRVEPNFVIQGGDPTGSGSGGPGYTIPDEDDGDHKMVEGVISMAKSGPNTTGSQFFITTGLGNSGSLSYLDPDFTVFGEVTSGLEVAKQIGVGDLIESITVEEQ